MRDLLRLLKLFRPYWAWALLGVLASTATLLANIALMATSGWFIAAMAIAGAAGVSMNYFSPAAIIRAAAIVRTGGRYLERIVTHEATFRLIAELRVWFYRHLEPLAPAALESYRSGDVLSRIGADIDTLNALYVRALVPVIVAALVLVPVTLVARHYHPALGWAVPSFLLMAFVALPTLCQRLGLAPGESVVIESSRLRTAVVDGVQGMAELTVCGASTQQASLIEFGSERLLGAQRQMSRIAGLSQAGLVLLSGLAVWTVTLIALPLVEKQAIDPPELAMLALFTMATFEAAMPLPDAFRLLGQTLTAARRLFAIVDSTSPISEPNAPLQAPREFALELQNLAFRYPSQSGLALSELDLNIGDGKHIAIIGPSGSGKSTLIQLLLRFREPNSGTIHLGDQPLSAYSSEDLRQWIAVVPQQVYLFNASIRDNLLLARPDADQATLEHACRIAQVHDFIVSQPEGYDTWVGETGVRLSGGQARRIAIARALLRDFRLLILDEPGEGLDTANEAALMDAVLEYLGDRGLILITHRKTGLKHMDHVFWMAAGRVTPH